MVLRERRERELTERLGFQRAFSGEAALVRLRRGSGYLWSTARL
jgi:hypothetical protein